MNDRLTYARDGDVAIITLDDGKANAFGFAMLEAVDEALERARKEARAVVLSGRPGILSGGFDLTVIRRGDGAELKRMLNLGVRTLMRLYGHPQPLVIAATGHAVALGALILLAGDHRVGTLGEFSVGLNETAIGLTLPPFAIELAEARLSRRWLTQATLGARLFAPIAAVDAGFLDECVAADQLHATALARARHLASYDSAAYAANKQGFRGAEIARLLATLDAQDRAH